MKKIFFLAALAGICHTGHAQLSDPGTPSRAAAFKSQAFQRKNSVQLELGGHGLFYSVNYERNLLNADHFKTSVQIGFSFYPAPIDLRCRLWVPVSFNQLISHNQHHLELGLGIVFTEFQNYGDMEGNIHYKMGLTPFLSGKAGYRYQKPDGRMQYKVLFTPLLERENGITGFHPLGAVSIGYTF